MTKRVRTAVVLVAATGLVALAPALAAGDDDTVVVSRPGVVYHKAGSLDVRGRGHERPLSEALAAGYTPCPICFAKGAGTTSGAGTLVPASLSVKPESRVVPPGLFHPYPEGQPFGLRIGSLYPPGGVAHDAVRDPYVEPQTITRPAKEQGAYSPPGS